jgi:hypothetical protein
VVADRQRGIAQRRQLINTVPFLEHGQIIEQPGLRRRGKIDFKKP